MVEARYEDPPFEEWPAVLSENVARRWEMPPQSGAVRAAMVERAAAFTERVRIRSAEAGYTLRVTAGNPEKIVMAGHQPVMFHRGLTIKTDLLARLCRESGAMGIHVIIDTDAGEPVTLRFPKRAVGGPGIMSRVLTEGEGLFASMKLAESAILESAFSEAAACLEECGFGPSAEAVRRAGAAFVQFGGAPVPEALTAIRWILDGHRPFLEVPFSDIATIPEVRSFIERMILDGDALFASYNEELDRHRAAHRIKNPANPFPNLKREDGRLELPFWTVSPGFDSREAMRVKPGAGTPPPGIVIPRGAIISTIMRVLCSDLFIHGRGGGRYDTFTDEWAERYLGVRPPRFVVASATRYLFESDVARLDLEASLAEALRDAPNHPERYFDDVRFPEETRAFLRAKDGERRRLIDAVRSGSRDEQADAKRRLSSLGRAVREHLDDSMPTPSAPDPLLEEVYRERQFPSFFFPAE